MADAHGVHELPGMPLVVGDPGEPAAFAVPYYFAQYEDAFELRVQRPVRVERVEPSSPTPTAPGGCSSTPARSAAPTSRSCGGRAA